MKKRNAQEQKLADDARLLRAWRKWHSEQLEEALAGVRRDVLERLVEQLKDLRGRAVGSLEAVVTLCKIPVTIIEPSVWKRLHGLRGGDKELSRQHALQLFPAAHSLLARKRDHGRAEAALIALAMKVK